MRKAMLIASGVAAISLGIAAPALSHHSHAMFDHTAEETITGTVADFAYRNPHVFLYVDVEGENDETLNYWIEMSNIPIMIRRGIGAGTFNTGDEVTVKRFKRDGKKVWLLAENPEFAPIEVDLEQQELVIEGLSVGVIRR